MFNEAIRVALSPGAVKFKKPKSKPNLFSSFIQKMKVQKDVYDENLAISRVYRWREESRYGV